MNLLSWFSSDHIFLCISTFLQKKSVETCLSSSSLFVKSRFKWENILKNCWQFFPYLYSWQVLFIVGTKSIISSHYWTKIVQFKEHSRQNWFFTHINLRKFRKKELKFFFFGWNGLVVDLDLWYCQIPLNKVIFGIWVPSLKLYKSSQKISVFQKQDLKAHEYHKIWKGSFLWP